MPASHVWRLAAPRLALMAAVSRAASRGGWRTMSIDELPSTQTVSPAAPAEPSRWMRPLPWVVALACLAVPLVGSGFVVWPAVLAWLWVLGAVFVAGRWLRPDRTARVVFAVVALPLLVALAWEGGWYLIPSVVVWLAVEGWAACRAAG
jgi:hypothetical protein